MKFAIVGLGSIGTRHQKNLESFGHQVILVHRDDNLEKIITNQRPDGVLICTPTSKHLEPALISQKHQLPVFIEKPISNNLVGVNRLKGRILVGYCLRFDTSLLAFKKKIDQLDKSKIKTVKIVAKSWLPDWHTGIDYTQSYSAKKELGGGVLLDLSHEIDYALWFFGPVKKVRAKLQLAPELKIETEAIADLELKFQSGVKAKIHLNFASRKKERFCEILTKTGQLRWNFQPNNDMYIEEMKHFVNVVANKESPFVTVTDGINVLRVIQTAKIGQ